MYPGSPSGPHAPASPGSNTIVGHPAPGACPPRETLPPTDRQRLALALGAQLTLRGVLAKGPGNSHTLSYELRDARGRYRQSMALHQELLDPLMEAHCLAGEAECLARDGRRGMARVLLERCASLTSEETPYLLRAKGWLARSEGRSAEAQALFTKALREAPIQAPEIVRELKEAVK